VISQNRNIQLDLNVGTGHHDTSKEQHELSYPPLPGRARGPASSATAAALRASSTRSSISASVYPCSSSASLSTSSLSSTCRLRSWSRMSLLGLRIPPSPAPASSPRPGSGGPLVRYLTRNLLVWTYPLVPDPRAVCRPMPLYMVAAGAGLDGGRRRRNPSLARSGGASDQIPIQGGHGGLELILSLWWGRGAACQCLTGLRKLQRVLHFATPARRPVRAHLYCTR
jgi:hypothetical protein